MYVKSGMKFLRNKLLGGIASCSASDAACSYTFLRSVVCLSVCRLSHSCTLVKPFDGFRCNLAGYLGRRIQD